MNYKASIHIDGATTQHRYGTNPDAVLKAGIKALSLWEPGFAACTPDKVVLRRSLGRIDGNTSRWEVIQTVAYKDLTEDQLEWRKKRKLQ